MTTHKIPSQPLTVKPPLTPTRALPTPEQRNQTVGRWIRVLANDIANRGDLYDLAEMDDLRNQLDGAMRFVVTRLREVYGYSWADVGHALGISRQAAQQRFRTEPTSNT